MDSECHVSCHSQRVINRSMSDSEACVQQKHVGSYGELKATLWLMDQGYDVFRNVSAAGLIDLVAIKGDEVLRLDVKYSRTGSNRQGAGGKGCNATAQRSLGIKWLYVLKDKFEIADPPDAKGRERRKCMICPRHFKASIGSAHTTCSQKCSAEHERRRRNESRKRRVLKRAKKREQTKSCVICTTSFTTSLSAKKACSTECSKENTRRRGRKACEEEKTCVICESMFTTTKSKKKTCSDTCADQHQHNRKVERNKARKRKFAVYPKTELCVVCQTEFTATQRNHLTCNAKCAENRKKTRSQKFRVGAQTKCCVMCQKAFTTASGRQITCSDKCSEERRYALYRDRYGRVRRATGNTVRRHKKRIQKQKLICPPDVPFQNGGVLN